MEIYDSLTSHQNHPSQRITRRDFLKTAGLFMGSTIFLPIVQKVCPVPLDSTLREYADNIITSSGQPFKIGIYLEGGDWNDPTGVPEMISGREFNHFVNHSINMSASYRGPDDWDFSSADWIVSKAQAANQSLIGMHLVWGWGVPEWIKNGGYNRDQLIQIMEAHIVTVMNRYKGIIGAYTVVNEINNGSWEWWYQQLGYDYLKIAFQKARETDPSAVLIYNNWGNHTKDSQYYVKTKQDIDFLKSMNLVDAVGVQLHLWSGRPTKNDVIDALISYGLPVWITEFDSLQYEQLSDPEQEQADITKSMIEAALESGVCHCFTNWGVSDKNSFWNDYYDHYYKPCLWDDNNNPKQNYYAIQYALGKNVICKDVAGNKSSRKSGYFLNRPESDKRAGQGMR
jgi:endo-1,4-beta-xylanase